MTLTVGSFDVTPRISANSVRLTLSGTFRSELSFTLETYFTDGFFIAHGMEAALTDDFSQPMWGGIVTEVREVYRSLSRRKISVRCKGYEHILSRRVCSAFSAENTMSGEVARSLFLTYLASTAENGEGLLYNPDFFSQGAALMEYSSPGAKLSQLFDDLAAADGSRWWVGKDKTFYFMESVPVTNAVKCVDLTETAANRLTDVSALEFTRETNEYRNVQIVVGADGVRGEARNTVEIARMAAFGGTGEYANVTVNKRITTSEAASAAAANILRTYENENAEAVFTTNTDGFALFDRVMINAPQFGCAGLTAFIITEITATDRKTDNGFGFKYTIRAKLAPDTNTYRPSEIWTETLSQLVGKSDTTAVSRISSIDSSLRPENIIAGRNVTVERENKNVTISSFAEADAVRLTGAEFSPTGVAFTTADGAETEYTFTFDGDGNIIKLTDGDGNEINVSYA